MADKFDGFFDLGNELEAIDDINLVVPKKNSESVKFRQVYAKQTLNNSVNINNVELKSKQSSGKKSIQLDQKNALSQSIQPSMEPAQVVSIKVADKEKKSHNNTQKTFWDMGSVENIYSTLANGQKVDFNQELYNDALNRLNKVFFRVRANNSFSEQNIEDIERLRTALLGNNLIPKLCGFGAKYKFDELVATIENAQKTNRPMSQIAERIEKDVCMGLCMAFAPMYMELSNSVRFTYALVSQFLKRLENMGNRVVMINDISRKFANAFDNANDKKVTEFMLNTNFAPAFNADGAVVTFNHLYDNVEKFNDPSKFNGDTVQLSSITNCFKIIDRVMGINYFNKKDLFELKSQKLDRDNDMDLTDITDGKGEKVWLN